MNAPLHIGVLGVASIVPDGLLDPARTTGEVVVAAIASRELARAERFAAEHGIDRAYGSYSELIDDDLLDAVYIPLPPSLHAEWSIAALGAGRHVLCEKPLAANAAEAEQMVTTARRSGRVLMEAFHWRYHPLAKRVLELLAAIAPLRSASARFDASMPHYGFRTDISLGGGMMMDVGCYPIHWLRTFIGEDPIVRAASAREGPPGIDTAMRASLSFPGGVRATMSGSMVIGPRLQPSCAELRLVGDGGQILVTNPMAPQLGHRLLTLTAAGTSEEQLTLEPSYRFQLDAFVAAVRDAVEPLTGGVDSIANMAAIDNVYQTAGLPTRPSRPSSPSDL